MDDSLNEDEKDFIGPKLKAVWSQITSPFKACPDELVCDNVDEYNFGHPSRGIAVIINNETFENKAPREGADVDRKNLSLVLRRFGFTDVRYHQDLTAERITNIFHKLSKENYKKADCFVCAVSSHGDEYFFDPDEKCRKQREDYILGTDYRPVRTRNLLEMFNDNNCPTLRGKPRIFLMQACRGKEVDAGVQVLHMADEVDGVKTMEPYVVCPSPLFKDFMIVYSTPPGFASFRRPREGSWFISALAECVATCDLNSVSLTQLLTRVIRHVSINFQSSSTVDPSLHEKKQTPCICSMLTKDVYFKSKN